LQAGSDMPFQGRIPLILWSKLTSDSWPTAFGINQRHLNDVATWSPRFNHLDVALGTISGHARECRDPIDMTNPAREFRTSLLTQDEPT
jgi:hypothetical protein